MKFPFKTSISILFSFSLAYSSLGQSDDAKPRYEAHWAGVDIGVSMLTNEDMGMEFANNMYWENDIAQSFFIHFNMLEYKIPIFKQYLGLTTGLGWHMNNYGFKDDYVLSYNDSVVTANQDLNQEYDRNYLSVHYLSVPLLLDFATERLTKKSFYLCAGVVGSLRIGSRTTLRGKYENGDKFNNVRRAKFNLNPIALDATVRMGYQSWGLFATYSITSLYINDKTVGVYPLRFGATLNIPSIGKDKSDEGRSFEEFEETIDSL